MTKIQSGQPYKSWLLSLPTALYFFYSIMQLTLFNSASSYIMQKLNIHGGAFGSLSSLYLYTLAITLLLAGYALDNFSTRKIAILTMLLSVLSTLLLFFSFNVEAVIIYRIITGAANGFAFLISLRVVAILYPRSIAVASGVIVSSGMSGGIFANILFSYLARSLSWFFVFFINSIIGIIFFIILLVFFRSEEFIAFKVKYSFAKMLMNIKTAIINKQNWLCGFYIGFLNLSVYLMATLWGNQYLIQKYKIINTKASIIVSMIFMGLIIGSPLWGYFSDKMKTRKLPMWIGALFSFFIALLILYQSSSSIIVLIVLFFLLGFSTSSQVIGYPTIAESNAISYISVATGFAALIINVVGALFQQIFGWLISLNWNGQLNNGVPVYSIHDIHLAFMTLPFAFLCALIVTFLLKETF